jgi:2-oxoglutarate ferredoxin oxidoreductase subunit delta
MVGSGEVCKMMTARKKITVYQYWCKKCGICIAFCPKKVLQEDESGYPILKDDQGCTGCGFCELRCPDFALAVNNGEKQFERTETEEEKPEVSGGGLENVEISNTSGK